MPGDLPTVEGLDGSPRADGFPGQRIVVLPREVIAKLRQNPLLNRLIPTDVGLFPEARGHAFERKTGIDQAIFIYCAKGRGSCQVRGRTHEVRAGHLAVIPPGEPHAYWADEPKPWTILWFHATGEEVPLLLPELGVQAENPVLPLGEDPQLAAVFGDVLDELEHGWAPRQMLHASKTLMYLISLMIRRARENWNTAPDTKQKIQYCIGYMRQHLEKPLRLNSLAQLAGFAPSYFNVLFREETGYSCMEFLTQLRIHQASQWLDHTDWPIKHIAARLGFEDPFYFSRVFSAIHGMSPKQYRQSHKG